MVEEEEEAEGAPATPSSESSHSSDTASLRTRRPRGPSDTSTRYFFYFCKIRFQVSCELFAKTNCLAFVFTCCSSPHSTTRVLAYYCLQRYLGLVTTLQASPIVVDRILVFIFDNKSKENIIETKTYEFNPSLAGENFVKQAYEYLKTLEEFKNAVDY